MFHYVYEITNLINGKKYIGKRSCKCPVIEDRYMGSGTALKNAFKKYGMNNFSKKIIMLCDTEEEAYKNERRLIESIKAYSDKNYYNIASGGEGGFFRNCAGKTVEEMQEIKEKVKATRVKLFGSENPMYGTKHTEEERKYLSETSKTLWQNDEFRNKTIEGLRKVQSTPEYKAKKGRHLGGDNAQSKKVVLLNTLTIFDAIADVERELKIKHQDISKVCKGKRLSAGKVDGEKAKWIYLEDYNYCLENSIENFDLYKKEKYKK